MDWCCFFGLQRIGAGFVRARVQYGNDVNTIIMSLKVLIRWNPYVYGMRTPLWAGVVLLVPIRRLVKTMAKT